MAGPAEEKSLQELVGYLEDPPDEVERRLLTRKFFPSKVGGRPAWLVPEHLPDPSQDLVCQHCGQGLRFLLQVYASQGEAKENCFHRSLFVFVCTNCQPNQARVFRAQLPRACLYYSSEEPDYEAARAAGSTPPDPELEAICCPGCGMPCSAAPAACGECQRRMRNGDPPGLFPEREISVGEVESPDEEEDEEQADGSHEAEDGDDKEATGEGVQASALDSLVVAAASAKDEVMMAKIKEYQEKLAKDPEAVLDKSEQKVYEEWCNERSVKDDFFTRFQRFSAQNQQHVLRYQLGGAPIWFCKPKQLEQDPPCCGCCGGPRQFEMQVQPQLIALLPGCPLAKRLDFGTLCVYSCVASCDAKTGNSPYIEEFAFVQPEPTDEWIPP